MKLYTFEKNYAMLDEAKKVIPNGIYGPRTPGFLTYGSYPCFLARGQGSHIWDIEGQEYIDFMCSFGTNIIGLGNEEVDNAAIEQMRRGDCFTLPSDRWLEMAHTMLSIVADQDWIVYAKNGSDVTTYATTIARAYTGKSKIIVAHHAYHGAHYWCNDADLGVPPEFKSQTLHFKWNDLDGLKSLIAAHKGDVAGIMLTPYHHPALADQEMPSADFYPTVRKLCDDEGMLLMVDDVRCGFRLNLHGSHVYFNFEPDIVCFGKAMANGYPIAAMTAKEFLMPTAQLAYITGTHFFSAVPMVAAMTTMRIIQRDGVVDYVHELGVKLRDGILQQAAAYGVDAVYSGHPALPFLRLTGDGGDFSHNRFFCGEAAKRGIFLHPHHNWFLSGAHTDADIEKALQVTDECFRLTKAEFYE